LRALPAHGVGWQGMDPDERHALGASHLDKLGNAALASRRQPMPERDQHIAPCHHLPSGLSVGGDAAPSTRATSQNTSPKMLMRQNSANHWSALYLQIVDRGQHLGNHLPIGQP
jgi:hypothetical protein